MDDSCGPRSAGGAPRRSGVSWVRVKKRNRCGRRPSDFPDAGRHGGRAGPGYADRTRRRRVDGGCPCRHRDLGRPSGRGNPVAPEAGTASAGAPRSRTTRSLPASALDGARSGWAPDRAAAGVALPIGGSVGGTGGRGANLRPGRRRPAPCRGRDGRRMGGLGRRHASRGGSDLPLRHASG